MMEYSLICIALVALVESSSQLVASTQLGSVIFGVLCEREHYVHPPCRALCNLVVTFNLLVP